MMSNPSTHPYLPPELFDHTLNFLHNDQETQTLLPRLKIMDSPHPKAHFFGDQVLFSSGSRAVEARVSR